MKKIYILLLTAAILLSACAAPAQLPETAAPVEKPVSEGAAALENSRFLLEVSENGSFKITDKLSGSVYTSSPENADEDEVAQGLNKSRLKSEYLLTLVNSSGGSVELNSFDASLGKEGISVEKTGDSVKVWYLYPDQGVMHSAEYTLDGDGFNVTLAFSGMTEQLGKISADDWGFLNIGVLPYFAASGTDSTGYMVVPDGSGAIINHNNKKSSYAVYAQEIYGRDPALSLETKTMETKTAPIPVFGNVEGSKGYTAVITDSAAEATIYAETSGVNSSYNNVYAGFAVRRTDSVAQSVSNGYGGSSTLARTAVSESIPANGRISIKYMLVSDDELSYVQLAKAYRKYLTTSGVEPKGSGAQLYLSICGGISDTEYTLGVPHKTVVPITTFSRGAEIIADLKAAGADNIAVRLTGWQKGGSDAKIPKSSKTEKKVGGDKNFELLSKAGADIFPEIDYVNLYKSGNGVSLQSDCAFALSGSAAYVYDYAVNTGNKVGTPSRLLAPEKAQALSKSFENGFENMSLGEMGAKVFSDFNRKAPVRRSEAAAIYAEIAEAAGEKVMITGGNSYALKGASHIFAMESEATGYDLEDGSVPFYQIAVHGLRSYSVPPINLTADMNRAMLKALETGSALCYSVCGGEAEDMEHTADAAPYSYIREIIASHIQSAGGVLKAVENKEITNHEKIAEDVYKTTFGTSAVYVNYSAQDYSFGEKTVEAGGFLFEEGAE